MKDIHKFIQVVSENDFVAGHEVLEDKWREWKNNPDLREESFILKGLINGATALALKVMKRDLPANQVWDTFKKYEPLIETLTCKNSSLYKQAQKLLHVKYAELF